MTIEKKIEDLTYHKLRLNMNYEVRPTSLKNVKRKILNHIIQFKIDLFFLLNLKFTLYKSIQCSV